MKTDRRKLLVLAAILVALAACIYIQWGAVESNSVQSNDAGKAELLRAIQQSPAQSPRQLQANPPASEE